MTRRVVFIDTSVLLHVLDVPGNSNHPDTVKKDRLRFDKLLGDGSVLVLPLTTVIETGNAIAQVGGGERFRCTATYIAILKRSLDAEAPWVTAGFSNSTALLENLLAGASSIPKLDELMNSGVGTGDASILAEVAEYRTKIPSATPVEIWTHDKGLSAYT